MFSREQVENRIKEMADQINEEYGDEALASDLYFEGKCILLM